MDVVSESWNYVKCGNKFGRDYNWVGNFPRRQVSEPRLLGEHLTHASRNEIYPL